ncbi:MULTISPECIES: restriction endonuclease subunit S [unclassified Streptomyces]|uniref:restriction endonuclease subunit S n=1 Tax=unclassified Streptomyces TaxID=2593676 RepID=UPI000FFED642|nr:MULTISPECIES: restriction endonuclease subunit S [unclassified Streptomyces]
MTELTRLGDVVDLLTGFPFRSAQFVDESAGVRLLRGDNIGHGVLRWDGAKYWHSDSNDTLEKYTLVSGDVIVAMDRPWISSGLKWAEVRHTDLPCLLVQRVARLRAKGPLDQSFLPYLMSGKQFSDYVQGVQTGTAVPHISPKQIADFRFHCPSGQEQRAVAEVLGVLDGKIAVNKSITEVSRKLAQDHYLNALYQDRVWESRPLGDVATVLMGQSPSGDDCNRSAEGIPLLNGPTEFGNYSPIPAQWTTAPTRLCETGDLLVCVRGSTTGRMNWADAEYVVGRGLAAIRAKSSPVETCLIYYALLQGMGDLLSRANGSVFPNLSRDVLNSFSIRWLGESVRHRIAMRISGLEDGIRARELESRTLATLRDALLPQLVSGRLRVMDAEKIVEDHV